MPFHGGGAAGVDDYADSFRIDQKRDGVTGANKRTAPLFGDVLAQAAKKQKMQEQEAPPPPAPEPALEVNPRSDSLLDLHRHCDDCVPFAVALTLAPPSSRSRSLV